ncbi:N-acyl-D-amino-acid deacylase family protein [Frankia sp. Cr2]|uniref:N-acyl-D-amino-acid deacylase family protein n=1 Tax=Frankia sp. Cr2 TaxID=3073932 RepID=UPI002AD4A82C|nr:amidohydrolase family protein [Frankia sp. Cr2]
MTSLIVRGGTVVDGTGGPGRRADVRVRDGRVVEVAAGLHPDGEPELDASGAIVAPGFIDTHTHVDPQVFWDPAADPLAVHGVTTALTGNCSLSLAPVRPEHRDAVRDLFCYVEDLPADVFNEAVDWGWSSYPEYRDVLRQRGFGVNLAAQVGHTPLRMWVMGEAAWERPATETERRAIAGALDESLAAGAFALSTSFFDEDAGKRPVPSRLADDEEFAALLAVVADHGAFLSYIPNVARRRFHDDVDRMARLCRPRGVLATYNGVVHDDQHPDQLRSALDRAAALQAQGDLVYPQITPRTMDIRFNWFGGMSFFALAAGWHRIVQAPAAEKRRLLADPQWRAVARAEWDRVPRTMFRHHEHGMLRLVSVTRPEHEKWVGRTFADLVAARGGHPSDVLADWLVDNDLNPGIVAVGVYNADVDAVAEALTHPAAIISNSDAGAHLQMMCAAGDTTLVLTRHVRERGDLTLEDAVHQLTGRQARLFGFAGRGVVEVGAHADLVVFDLDELRYHPEEFVDDLPGGASRLRRAGGGYRATIVSGVLTQETDHATGAHPGTLLDARR